MTLGPQPGWLESRSHCGHNPQPERSPIGDCGQPATHHIQLRDGDGYVAACADHAGFALAHLPVVEWHRWEAVCNMPGTLWHPSPTPDEADSFCAIDDSGEEPTLIGAEPLLAEARR